MSNWNFIIESDIMCIVLQPIKAILSNNLKDL